MPIVKLLDAYTGSTAGSAYKLGQTPPPYTIRCEGTTVDIDIETAEAETGGNWRIAFGKVYNTDSVGTKLEALGIGVTAMIEHKVHYIRANPASCVAATVYLETVI